MPNKNRGVQKTKPGVLSRVETARGVLIKLAVQHKRACPAQSSFCLQKGKGGVNTNASGGG